MKKPFFAASVAALLLGLMAAGCGGGGGGADVVRPHSPAATETDCRFVVSEGGVLKRVDSESQAFDVIESPPFAYAMNPSLRRSDRRIVFTAVGADGAADIWSCGCEGAGLMQLTRGSGVDGHPDWSPDGASIVFQRANAIYRMQADGTGQTGLTDTGAINRRPRWANGDGGIVFASNRSGGFEVWKMAPDGGGQVRLTEEGGMNPEWLGPEGGVVFERASAMSAAVGAAPRLPDQDAPRLFVLGPGAAAPTAAPGATALDRLPVGFGTAGEIIALRGSGFVRISLADGDAEQLY